MSLNAVPAGRGRGELHRGTRVIRASSKILFRVCNGRRDETKSVCIKGCASGKSDIRGERRGGKDGREGKPAKRGESQSKLLRFFPELKKGYIDTGKVRFIFREFSRNTLDVAAFVLARFRGLSGRRTLRIKACASGSPRIRG
jgi:hypothetical protein